MKYLFILLSFFSLGVFGQSARVRQVVYPSPEGALSYPLIVMKDSVVSKAINAAIREEVLENDEGGNGSIRNRLTHWVKHRGLSGLWYDVGLNAYGYLSLRVQTEETMGMIVRNEYNFNFDLRTGAKLGIGDLIAADRIDSFRAREFRDKVRFIRAYKDGDLPRMLEKKEIDSGTYAMLLERVDSNCFEKAEAMDFSLSEMGAEVMDPCVLGGHAFAGYNPGYDLKYTYTELEPFMDAAFRQRIAARGPDYRVLHFVSAHTPFPDTARDRGHLDGDSIFQPRAGHYDDSSVLMIVPRGFKAGSKADLVFWFHGWHNNIDTALRFYGLARQFAASGVNAILVLPEAARQAADSYAGKLGQEGMFKGLVADVMAELRRQQLVTPAGVAAHVVVGGHSGGYVAIADILAKGGQRVDEVWLFDALYGHVDDFMNWIGKDTVGHHFVHWFTNKGGGTDEVSDTMMLQLRRKGRPYGLVEETALTRSVLESTILFVHSPREHNVIINDPDDFQLLLENSHFLTK